MPACASPSEWYAAFSVIESAGDQAQSAFKKTACGRVQMGWCGRKLRRVRDLSCGGALSCAFIP
jgi:hypothetical protein